MSERKGHAILIGIDEFVKWEGKLDYMEGLSDVDYWYDLLQDVYDYTIPIQIREEKVTLKNVILAFCFTARAAKEGDVVTISFSTHCRYMDEDKDDGGRGYSMCMYHKEEFLTDELLYFLLRLFKKNVRINLILDVCQSDRFVSSIPLPVDKEVEKQIEEAFEGDTFWSDWLKDVVDAQKEIAISASVAVLATANRYLNARDGFIKVYTKEVIDLQPSKVKRVLDNFEGFRSKLEVQLEEHYQEDSIINEEHVSRYVIPDNPRMDRLINSLPKSLKEYMEEDSVEFPTLLHTLGGMATTNWNRRKFTGWLNFYRLAKERCPHLNWRGVPSEEFKKQCVFTIEPNPC